MYDDGGNIKTDASQDQCVDGVSICTIFGIDAFLITMEARGSIVAYLARITHVEPFPVLEYLWWRLCQTLATAELWAIITKSHQAP